MLLLSIVALVIKITARGISVDYSIIKQDLKTEKKFHIFRQIKLLKCVWSVKCFGHAKNLSRSKSFGGVAELSQMRERWRELRHLDSAILGFK